MAFGYEGRKTRLVPLDKGRHLDNCVAWLNDPAVTGFLDTGYRPLTRLAEEEWFDRAMSGSSSDVTFAIETLAGEHLGNCGIFDIDHRHGHGTTGLFIGRRDLWGQGYGTDAMQVRTRYAFDVLGLRLLLSWVQADNAGCLRALGKTGYVEIGRVPQMKWARGAYRDFVLLAVTREAWSAGTPG